MSSYATQWISTIKFRNHDIPCEVPTPFDLCTINFPMLEHIATHLTSKWTYFKPQVMVQHCDMHTSAIDILEKRSGIPYDAINGKDVASIHIYTDGSHGLKMEDDSLSPAGWDCIICV